MDYNNLISGMKRFGSTEEDILKMSLGVNADEIRENVVIAPYWKPDLLPGLGAADLLSSSVYGETQIWSICFGDNDMTYIRTGIGAPQFLECLLPLGLTKCKRIVFIGSVGSMDADIAIGDIVIPEYSICGDGASRYLSSDDLTHDVFGEKVYPDQRMLDIARNETMRICRDKNVRCHIGRAFGIDTIFAQYAHIDTILGMGCNVIEMETAAAFRAAKLMGIPMVALLSVSDNTVTNKSLVSGRTQEDMEYRRYVRHELFPEIINSIFIKCICKPS